jgi:Na+-driven multidrug efflux pump
VSSLYGGENPNELFKDILASAIPTTVAALMIFLKETINLIFIGHLNDPVKIASIGMGDTTRMLLGIGMIYGLNTSLEI